MGEAGWPASRGKDWGFMPWLCLGDLPQYLLPLSLNFFCKWSEITELFVLLSLSSSLTVRTASAILLWNPRPDWLALEKQERVAPAFTGRPRGSWGSSVLEPVGEAGTCIGQVTRGFQKSHHGAGGAAKLPKADSKTAQS